MTLRIPPAAIAAAFLSTVAAAAEGERPPPADQAPAARPEYAEEILVKGKKRTRVDTMETREVRESPARDLGEALAQQGLAAAIRKGGIASDVVLRGFQRDNLAVTIDGAKLHGACPNRMDPPSFHVDYAEVDRVELRKGPFDVASQGGLGGTLDVRTRSPEPGASGEVNVGYGRFGALETSATLGYGGERLGLLGGAAWKEAKAFESGDGIRFTELYPASSPNRYRGDALGRDAYGVATGWAKLTAAPAAGHRAELSFARQQADDVLYPFLRMDARYDDTDRVNAAYETGAVGPLSRARAQAYFTHVAHDMDDARRCSSAVDAMAAAGCGAALPRGWSMRTLAESWVAGGSAEAAFSTAGETVIGVDLSVRGWNSETTRYLRAMATYATEDSIPDVTTSGVGLRAQHALDLGERVTLHAGARLDLVRTDPGDDRSAEYAKYHPDLPRELRRDDVLVSGNVQADVRVTSILSAFAGYGHGERVPDAQERYFALSPMGTSAGTVGLPTLDPVRNDELDLGAKLTLGPLLVKAQVFHAWLADYVAVVGVRQLANPALRAKSYAGVSATMWGGEASARVALPWDLYASASLGYTEGRNLTAGTWLAEMPPLRGAASLRYDRTRWFAEVETVAADDQHSVDDAVGEQPTGGWAILNLKAGVVLGRARLFAGVRNLFDRAYVESLSHLRDPFATGVRVPEPGRAVYANVQAGF